MKNFPAFILSITLIISLGFGFSSCKEDEPPAKPKLSFADSEITVNEDDGVLEVELVLDKAHSKDLRIEYELGGTASDQDVVGTANADYEVEGSQGVVEIEAGETSGVIELNIYPDAAFEDDETIEIAILDTNTDEIELTAEDEVVITVTNDDEQLQLSFLSQSLSFNEADQLVKVEVQLDKPAPRDITISYELAGSATDSITASREDLNADYYINGDAGQFEIKAGETKGAIEIALLSDLLVEDSNNETDALDPENILLTITNTGGATMADKEMEVLIKQEDGLIIALLWPDSVENQYADMDLLLRVGRNTTEWLGVLTGSVNGSSQGPEIIFIPNILPYEGYGLSYTYYGGTLDPLTFQAVFIEIVNSALEPSANALRYEATYTAANKNEWTDVSSTKVVQTFAKAAPGFSTPSDITVPTEGSRFRSNDNFKSPVRRGDLKVTNDAPIWLRNYHH